ncbi:MAG: LptF/LptG family permease [Candidatus Hydrogenedentales bacterium]|jgi:lipopolysaccharide export system permease protein
MKTLDRYLIRRMVGALARNLFALVMIYVLIDLLTRRDMTRFDVPFDVVIRYYLNSMPQVISRVAPFAMLIASLLVLGDAVQNNEITAVLSGGISLRRFVVVPILIAMLFAFGLYYLDEKVGAEAAREATRIEEGYFSLNPDVERKGISWANLSGGWTCHIAKFNSIALTGENVLIYARTPESVQQIEARRIYWDASSKQWMLEDGRWFTFNAQETAASGLRIRQRPAPFSEPPDSLFALEKPVETKSSAQLRTDIHDAEKRAVPASGLWVDYYAKFSQPALSFVMIWLAIPFAVRLRRGGLAISFATSLGVAIAYLLIFSVTMELGHAGRLSPPVAAWLANGLFFAIGVVLFWRTPS